MSYRLEINLPGLPKIITNGSQGSWRTKWSNAKKWKRAVGLAVRQCGEIVPCTKAKLILTRFSSVEPDFDGLVASFKPCIDGLVEIGLLVNDKSQNIGQPEYHWVKAKPGKGQIRIEVIAWGECTEASLPTDGLFKN